MLILWADNPDDIPRVCGWYRDKFLLKFWSVHSDDIFRQVRSFSEIPDDNSDEILRKLWWDAGGIHRKLSQFALKILAVFFEYKISSDFVADVLQQQLILD
jgi:hypothetical protein